MALLGLCRRCFKECFYECVSIFLVASAYEESAMEEAFPVLLHAGNAEMVLFVRLSPRAKHSTRFMFMGER